MQIQVIQRREGTGGLDLSSRCVLCSPFHLDEALPGVLVSADAGLGAGSETDSRTAFMTCSACVWHSHC